jgi:hypothetical protein
MDQAALVTEQIEAGRDLLRRLAAKHLAVSAAWWAKTSEDGKWKLYLSLPVSQQTGLSTSYQVVNQAVREMGESGELVRKPVTIVRSEELMAQAAVSLSAKTEPDRPLTYSGPYLGNVLVDSSVIYPPFAQINASAAH